MSNQSINILDKSHRHKIFMAKIFSCLSFGRQENFVPIEKYSIRSKSWILKSSRILNLKLSLSSSKKLFILIKVCSSVKIFFLKIGTPPDIKYENARKRESSAFTCSHPIYFSESKSQLLFFIKISTRMVNFWWKFIKITFSESKFLIKFNEKSFD